MTNDQKKGLIGTIVFHVVLILLLMFLALRTPLPLPGEEGVEVNFGYDETGLGNVQKDNPPPKATPPPKQKVKPTPPPPPEPEPKQEEENLTQDTEEAPALEKKTETKKKPEKKVEKKPEKKQPEEKPKYQEKPKEEKPEPEKQVEEKPVEKPEPQVNRRALFKGSSKNKTGSSQGITKKGCDQGKPHGYEESNKYDGQGGEGNGPSYYLGGRGAKDLYKPEEKFDKSGTIVINIWVDPSGKVVKAEFKIKGSDSFDSELRKIAIKAALNSTFDPDPNTKSLQRGTITYKFIAK